MGIVLSVCLTEQTTSRSYIFEMKIKLQIPADTVTIAYGLFGCVCLKINI